MIDGGELADGIPARVSVPAGAAVSYSFSITRRGNYKLASFGLGRTFRARLEDSDGWPLVPPNGEASFEMFFEKGSYRLVVLPEAVAGKQLTRLDRVKDAPKLSGHGPHPLALGACATDTWTEPASEAAPRDPDVFEMDVTAPIDASLSLTGEMEGTLYRTDGGAKTPAGTVGPNGFTGPLEMGHYRLEARCSRRNNRVSYRVCANSQQFVPGLAFDHDAPVTLDVSVGKESLVELSSFGRTDVRATLTDTAGHFVASNDDRPDDWNFLIARKLSPGRYRLAVDPVGNSGGRVNIAMNVPTEIAEPALSLPVKQQVRSANEQHVYPLTMPAGADFLVVSARAQESIGVTVERESGGAWKPLGTSVGRNAHLEIPLADSRGSLRLRLWSIDRRGTPATLRVAAARAPQTGESSLESGLSLGELEGTDLAIGVARVALSRPSSFRLEGDPTRVRYTAAPDRAAEVSPDGSIVGTDGAVWIVADLAGTKSKAGVRAPRIVLHGADRDGITLPVPADAPLVADVESSAGPVVVMATSRGGQPGVRVEDAPSKTPSPGIVPFATATRTAVGVSLSSRKPAAVVWSAMAGDPIEARLVATAFPAPQSMTLAPGVT
ncbi:MAG TPA: hypothetical protein VLV15_08720, partial [Dongiaceae bacterium]|nr:hypothetical protein [Dongiaceae bacterium]